MDDISFAYKIAAELEESGRDIIAGGTVLAMAMGIMAAGDPRGHRNLSPLIDAQVKAAQVAFDALRKRKSDANI